MIRDVALHPVTKAPALRSFRNFIPLHRLWVGEKTRSLVKRDHGPVVEGAASFHTTRSTMVRNAAQSQAQGAQAALVELRRRRACS